MNKEALEYQHINLIILLCSYNVLFVHILFSYFLFQVSGSMCPCKALAGIQIVVTYCLEARTLLQDGFKGMIPSLHACFATAFLFR